MADDDKAARLRKLREDRRTATAMGATADVLRAFRAHKSGAKRRGIAFRFDLVTWWTWWSEGDRWARRGRHRCGAVMGRPGDAGAYEPGNVVCFTPGQNFRDRPRHHIARPVRTPDGRGFPSAAAAAAAFGITAAGASRRARARSKGWRYADEDEDAEAAAA